MPELYDTPADLIRFERRQFINPDRLHQNDWSYLSVTRALATAIAEAVARPNTAMRSARGGRKKRGAQKL